MERAHSKRIGANGKGEVRRKLGEYERKKQSHTGWEAPPRQPRRTLSGVYHGLLRVVLALRDAKSATRIL